MEIKQCSKQCYGCGPSRNEVLELPLVSRSTRSRGGVITKLGLEKYTDCFVRFRV